MQGRIGLWKGKGAGLTFDRIKDMHTQDDKEGCTIQSVTIENSNVGTVRYLTSSTALGKRREDWEGRANKRVGLSNV